jgi:hypothetical protein
MRIPDCHPDKKHQGGGLCRSCYCKKWNLGKGRGKGRVYTYIDLTGQMFGNWKAIAVEPGRYFRSMQWLCECQCELKTLKVISANTLKNPNRPNPSCGCIGKNRLRPYEALYNNLLHSNKWDRTGRLVYFSYEEFLEFTKIDKCHYCTSPIYWTKFNLLNGSAYNLDRKNNDIDYTLNNCVVCCIRCNKAKRDFFSYEDWYGMTEYLRTKNGGS